jgi:hypothetical protein
MKKYFKILTGAAAAGMLAIAGTFAFANGGFAKIVGAGAGSTNFAVIAPSAIGSGDLNIATATSYNVIGTYANDIAADTGYDWGLAYQGDNSSATNFWFGVGGTVSSISYDMLVTGNNFVIDVWGSNSLKERASLIDRNNQGNGAHSQTITTNVSNYHYFLIIGWQAGATACSLKNFTVSWTC